MDWLRVRRSRKVREITAGELGRYVITTKKSFDVEALLEALEKELPSVFRVKFEKGAIEVGSTMPANEVDRRVILRIMRRVGKDKRGGNSGEIRKAV